MKSGTTTLHSYLIRHPQVFMCHPKEPMFFSRTEINEHNLVWYKTQFAPAQSGQICGEASTCYSRWPHFGDVPGRIAETVENPKFIYLMRHPVERAYSHYRHSIEQEHRHLKLTFEDALKHDPEIIDADRYIDQINQYRRYFGRDQLLLLLFDDLKNAPRMLLDRVQRFLGLEQRDLLTEEPLVVNRGDNRPTVKWNLRKRVRQMRNITGIKQMIDQLSPERRRWLLDKTINGIMRSPVGSVLQHNERKRQAPLRPETRRHLLETYEQPTQELERLLDQDLSHWRT